MAARSTTWSTGGLLLICSALAAIVGLELGDELPIAPEVTAAPPAAPAPAPQEPVSYEPPAPGKFDEIANRPLFSESRRPFVPKVEEEAAAEPSAGPETTAPEVELVGVLLADRQRAAALIAPVGGGPAEWLYEGQIVQGWVLESIGSDQATLRRGERAMVLQLRSD